MDEPETAPGTPSAGPDVHQQIGTLTRQLHNALNELGYADPLRGSAGELPDAQNRLSYIARLTGEAAEKVLGRVEQAKVQHEYIASETKRVLAALIADPVATVAKGEIYNHLVDMERATTVTDAHLTEIMMAQDFHDLTGQVIARVVKLASTIEQQLLQLLVQTAPAPTQAQVQAAQAQAAQAQAAQLAQAAQPVQALPENPIIPATEHLGGPVVDPEHTPGVVSNQSEVDDLLASLGF